MKAISKALKGIGGFILTIWRHPKGKVGLIIAGILKADRMDLPDTGQM